MSEEYKNKFAVFILTHGRADRVVTYKTLRKQGYTGNVYFVVDDEDSDLPKYQRRFGKENVLVFSKSEIAKTFDEGDNFGDRRAIIYARNASFDLAEKLGLEYFLELDDDYTEFLYTFTWDEQRNKKYKHFRTKKILDLDKMFSSFLEYFSDNEILSSVAFLQGGDFIGGVTSHIDSDKSTFKRRKCMNTFFLSTKRRFNFVGRINEDVNTYIKLGSMGKVFISISEVSIKQTSTQKNKGGMADIYLDYGTFLKTFYSVMYHPSSVLVSLMETLHPRLHHMVKWRFTVPQIIREKYKKQT